MTETKTYFDSVAEKSFYNDLYSNPLLFAKVILPHHFTLPTPYFHREIISFLQFRQKYNCIIAPRNHSKSTLITLLYVLWNICFQEANYIIIISDTESQAKEFLDTLKNEIEENEILHSYFGKMKGADKWGETEIITMTGVKVLVRGATQKIRGRKHRQFRPDLIILDDIENDENIESKEQRAKLMNWYYKAVQPALADNGRIVYVGTILHYDSLLNKVSKDTGYGQLFYQAIQKDNTPLWKEKYSIEALQDIKRRFTEQGLLDAFMTEYQNEPLSDENAIFKKKFFRYFTDDDILLPTLSIFTTVDLAISKEETADYTVVLTAGIDSKNNIYILEYDRKRIDPIETINVIFRHVEKWNPITVGIESVAYQKSLQWFVAEEMRRRNKFFPLEELKADRDKGRRIKGLQPRYAVGSVFHRNTMTELEEELLLFPKNTHDDIADALAYIPQIAFLGSDTNPMSNIKHLRPGQDTIPNQNNYKPNYSNSNYD